MTLSKKQVASFVYRLTREPQMITHLEVVLGHDMTPYPKEAEVVMDYDDAASITKD